MLTGKQIPAAAIRRVWLDERLTTAQAAAEVGLTRASSPLLRSSIVSLHPVVGASDGKGRLAEPQAQSAPGRSGGVLRAPAATVAACEPSSPRASSSLRAGWGWLIRAARRLDDHWIGDLIGALCLFGMLWIGLVAAMVFE
ncbi:hypothetical protein PSA7680_02477 [Pseudoruegeria aquimaris]|uniref:Uncharacterized protein n=1 Tax=Pseudoruegeria aquimaris TaxID=393663 RepID=A0A1Y5SYK0_9RHOB|nr:hypothetical protein [Pseudoruegeria aquimaris]SLN48125.1 hypothetical protein PSA7680_02477 [Pseudoruegeria aquimaris]